MRLLFVEDHATFAQTVAAEFMQAHAVSISATVANALAVFAAEDFDAVLVDFDVADRKGDEFVRAIRAAGSRIPVVAVSAHSDGNAALLDAGANVVCAKASFAKIGAVLDRLAPLPARGHTARPLPAALAGAVSEFEPALTSAQLAGLDGMLEALLFTERDAWRAFLEGIITHTELRNLLLAHTATFVERVLGAQPDFVAFTLALVSPFERELFAVVQPVGSAG